MHTEKTQDDALLNQQLEIDNCLVQRAAIDSGKVNFHALTHGHYPGRRIAPELLNGVPSIGFFDSLCVQDWGIPFHRNEGVEICFQQTGQSVLNVDGKLYELKTHALSITRPWQLHRMGDPYIAPGRLYWFILDVGVRQPDQDWMLPDWCMLTEADRKELVRMLRGNEHPVWQANSRMSRIFDELGQLVQASDPVCMISKLRVLLNTLLLDLLELMHAQKLEVDESLMTKRRVVQIFLDELKRDPMELAREWSLPEMAAVCNMGRTAFSNYCHDLVNMTPIQALNYWRLDHAAHLLRTRSEISITELALDCGFSSSQYFSRAFRRRFRCSPREYRIDPM